MYVRLSRIADLTAAQTEEMVQGFLDGTYPRGDLPKLDGFLGYASAVDRSQGRVCVMSAWEDVWGLIDSRKIAAAAQAERLQSITSEPLIDEYEIDVWRVPHSDRGSHIRVSRFGGLVEERATALVDDFTERISGIERMHGYEGYLLGSAVEAGRIVTIGQWATRKDLDKSERIAASFREQQLELAKPCRQPMVDRYEIVTVSLAEDRMPALAA